MAEKSGASMRRLLFIIFCVGALLSMAGCSGKPSGKTETEDERTETAAEMAISDSETEELVVDVERAGKAAALCWEVYQENTGADTLDLMEKMVNCLGENGFAAVDEGNQIDMAGSNQVIDFCGQVDAHQEAELEVVVLSSPDRFIFYDFTAFGGNVDVARGVYCAGEGGGETWNCESTGAYTADFWEYTQDGYLIFSGTWFSEDIYILTLGGVEEHRALRVEPLDIRCRELNRQYILPIGYEQNNMFITDWSEDDFDGLDFYDMYDIFYPLVYDEASPYVMDDNWGEGAIYEIAEADFEQVILRYFKIDRAVLQSKTRYNPEMGIYEYRPRGFYEGEYPEHPFPEVTDYVEHADGTITLTVHAVFPYRGSSKVYAHEVVIRPLEDGGVQYVSNHILPFDGNQEISWYTPRLTDEQWDEVYGE